MLEVKVNTVPYEGPIDIPVIMIVEDDPVTRRVTHHLLANEGYQVIEAKNAEECLDIFKKSSPNLVLLDAKMPGIGGFECCRQIMKLPGSDYIPILMITGLEEQIFVDLAFDIGASDYITKPIHWPVLKQRVRFQLERVQLNQQLEEANRKLRENNQKLEASNKKLANLASIDSLTHLANRRTFIKKLEEEWQHREHGQLRLSLILADIDHFKTYNDTYGHPQGDQCLSQVAHAIKECAKEQDGLAARYGGEEFAVLLPDASISQTKQVAEAIRLSIKNLAIPHANSPTSGQVTISLGLASFIPGQQMEGAKILLKKADIALYQAKSEGRNRFSIYSESGQS